MSIEYLCYDCAKLLNMTGFDAVNEVGRKRCVGCGGNDDNLIVVNKREADQLIMDWNATHHKRQG